MRTLPLAAAAVIACAGMAAFASQAFAADCPTQDEAQASILTYINTDYWSPSQRDTWKVAQVDGFTFSPIQIGDMSMRQVEYGKGAQPVCPVRVVYSFNVLRTDGSTETTTMGEGKTHLFYQNPFHEWLFKVE